MKRSVVLIEENLQYVRHLFRSKILEISSPDIIKLGGYVTFGMRCLCNLDKCNPRIFKIYIFQIGLWDSTNSKFKGITNNKIWFDVSASLNETNFQLMIKMILIKYVLATSTSLVPTTFNINLIVTITLPPSYFHFIFQGKW